MTRLVLVGFAGALGTMARYQVAVWSARAFGTTFPYGTLAVNVVGCFLIALIAEIAVSTHWVSPTLRLTLATGFVGGLTTYSAFNFETTRLFQERAWATGLLNVCITLVACFAAGLLGFIVAQRVVGAG